MNELKTALEKLGFEVHESEDIYVKRLVIGNGDDEVEFSFNKDPYYKPSIYARGDGMMGISAK